ncbi:VOC family protein [Phytohabitans sp. LJ34]|uniref:VOC family protein n=1 Tax=Phytohabitans sp. LJ34 TaxID=3452217 RepID=UPI003F8AEAC0
MSVTFSHDDVGIAVRPEDLDATIQWYASKLGFVLDQRFDSHGTTFAFIISGDVKIELLAGASNRREARPDNVFANMDPERLHHFCLAVEDLDTTVSHLRDSDVPASPPP